MHGTHRRESMSASAPVSFPIQISRVVVFDAIHSGPRHMFNASSIGT